MGTLGYSDTQGYIAIPYKILEVVLREGYKVAIRPAVPCSFDPEAFSAVQKLRAAVMLEEDDVAVLQVHGVAEELLDRERGIIRCQHLPVANLRSGIFHRRGASEFNAALCPLCGLEPSGATVEERGRVGLARYRKGAFVVTPCKRDECAEKMRERQRRLSGGEVKTLYHQTSAATARRIHDGGGFLMRGQEGIAGGGIYFAFSARETEWKCEHGDDDAVVLECAVRVGKTREVERGDEDEETTFAELIQDGVDSVLLKRGVCKDAGPFYGKPAGDEVVVYSWEQARVLRTVPRDPVP